jgi:hypothetical protein
VVINDLYVFGISGAPDKTDSPLAIYSDAVLSFPITLQSFESIRGRQAQIIKPTRGIDRVKLHKCTLLNNTRKSSHKLPVKDTLSIAATKRSNHKLIVNKVFSVIKLTDADKRGLNPRLSA